MPTRRKTKSATPAATAAVEPLPLRAEALLEAQVDFIVARLQGEALTAWVTELVDAGLSLAADLKLADVVDVDSVKASACTYAAEVELGGGLPELVAEIASDLHAHPAHARTRLADLMPDTQFRAWLDQLLELRQLRERLLRGAVESPIYAEFVSDLLYHGIRGYLTEGSATRIPGARSALALGKALLDKAGLESSIEEGLRKYIARSVGGVSRRSADFLLKTLDDDALREAALDAWKRIKPIRVGDLRDDLTRDELEALFVTGYEYWRTLRRTDYYRELIEAGIERFFKRYGKQTLATLLDDIGITREMMIAEGVRYAPRAIQTLKKQKLLAPLIRRQLEPFYRSPAALKLLAG
jgi:hypothetical protein